MSAASSSTTGRRSSTRAFAVRKAPILLAMVSLVVAGCADDGGSTAPTISTPQPVNTGTSDPPRTEPTSQEALDDVLSSAAGADSSEDGYEAFRARAQESTLAAESIARQLRASEPAGAGWQTLDGGHIQEFADNICDQSYTPEEAAQQQMELYLPGADLRSAPALSQALLFVTHSCGIDPADLNGAGNVFNEYITNNQLQSQLSVAQQVQRAPSPPSAVGGIYRGVCSAASFSIRKVLQLGGFWSLFVRGAATLDCPRWVAKLAG